MTPETYDQLVSEVRRYSSRELLALFARETSSIAHDLVFGGDKLQAMRRKPWTYARLARIALLAGSDLHRRKVVAGVVERLRDADFELSPTDDVDPSMMLNRLASEQYLVQQSPRIELSRAWLLFGKETENFVPLDWTPVLGCGLDRYIRTLFALYVLLIQQGGRFQLAQLQDPELLHVIEWASSPSEFQAVLAEMTCTSDSARLAAGIVSRHGLRIPEYGFNPLVSKPFIDVGAGNLVAPCVPLVILAGYSSNLYYRGLRHWGTSFTDELGLKYQWYVGELLAALKPRGLLPEVVFNSGQDRSVDWIVVLAECVLLVEVKSARITVGALNEETAYQEMLDRLRHGVEQIETTEALVASGDKHFAHIPRDRPHFGMVVTSEDLWFAGFEEGLDGHDSQVPFEVLSVRDLEGVVSAWGHDDGSKVVEYFGTRVRGQSTMLSVLAAEGIPREGIEMLDDAWSDFGFVTQREVS